MKINYFLLIIILTVFFFFFPEVIKTKQLKDSNLSCEELDLEILEAHRFRNEAEIARSSTTANAARMILFWPAWAKTIHNGEKAVDAANDRIYHLDIMKVKKKCTSTVISNVTSYEKTIIDQLRELKVLLDSGAISQTEYAKAKDKILN